MISTKKPIYKHVMNRLALVNMFIQGLQQAVMNPVSRQNYELVTLTIMTTLYLSNARALNNSSIGAFYEYGQKNSFLEVLESINSNLQTPEKTPGKNT